MLDLFHAERIPRRSSHYRPTIEPLEGRSLMASSLTQLPLPNTGGALHDFLEGPDGTFWFVQDRTVGTGDNRRLVTTLFGKITPQGKITLIPIPASDRVEGLRPLADGTLWFGLLDSPTHGVLSEVTPTNKLRVFPNLPTDPTLLPISRFSPGSPDDFWYVDNPSPSNEELVPASRVRIVRISPRGGIQTFPVPAALPGGGQGLTVWQNTDMVRAPDGAYWFEQQINGVHSIAEAFVRVSPTGQAREFFIPFPEGDEAIFSFLNTFTFSRDGSVWFLAPLSNVNNGLTSPEGMFRMFPNGRISLVASAPFGLLDFEFSGVGQPVADSLGNVWFTIGAETGAGTANFVTVVRADVSGRLSAFEVAVDGNLTDQATNLVLSPGPDGSMYFVSDTQTVGRISRFGQVSYVNLHAVANPAQAIPFYPYISLFSTSSNFASDPAAFDDSDPLTESSGSVLVAPNGDIWFVSTIDGQITRFRPPARSRV